MAGRGRGLTLPAWMTEGGLKPLDPSTLERAPLAQQTTATIAPLSTPTPLPTPTPTPALAPSNSGSSQRFAPTQASGPRPPLTNPPFGGSAPGMAPFSSFPMHGINNGFPIPGMMSPFIPPMGQSNHFMNMGHGFPNPAMLPNFVPPPQMPAHMGFPAAMPQQPKVPPPPAVIGDPNNDVSCWAEHESEAGKKYWYNRVSLVSTYDKPFCLKTPEERSIPPCEWKEYSSTDGKKYYSNGKESLWTMPEEFRIWKELVEAAEQKKIQAAAARAAEAADASVAAVTAASEAKNKQAVAVQAAAAVRAAPAVVYATPAEAAEAFKELLADMKVTSIAKMREVQDLCQQDVRWEALKSQGEKKQALAEYQTRRLKQEKEQQKLKARKQRDAFLMMLAENTDIDARTRWRDATLILQDDARYKNVEDARDREDLFLEFIVELEKKEKDDKRKLREGAIAQFRNALAGFAEDGKIDHTSIWAESKKHFLDLIVRTEFRAMDDSDFRRTFQDFTAELLEAHRLAEKKKKEEFERELVVSQSELRAVLETVASSGRITHETRWRDVLALSDVSSSIAFTKMQMLFPSESDKDGSRFTAACKDVMNAVQDKLYEQYRLDRRLVKDIMHAHSFKVQHDMTYPQLRAFALKVARVQECAANGAEGNEVSVQQPVLEAVPMQLQEEGEEHDDLPGENLKAMMLERPSTLPIIFAELHKKAVADHDEEVQYAHKVEKKFLALLSEHFYRVEHADVPWDDAKRTLQRRSVYDELSKTDRRRLFAEHMEALRTGGPRSDSVSVSLAGGGGSTAGKAAGAGIGAGAGEGPSRSTRRSESKNRSSRRSESKDRRRQRSYSHHGRTVEMLGGGSGGSGSGTGGRDRSSKRSSEYDDGSSSRDAGRDKRARTAGEYPSNSSSR